MKISVPFECNYNQIHNFPHEIHKIFQRFYKSGGIDANPYSDQLSSVQNKIS